MFRRRQNLTLSKRFNRLMWPHMGMRRTLRYFRLRIVRLSAAPGPLARAIASGVAVSFFPVLGTHAMMAAALAFLLRANLVAAALASLLIPPVILPLVFSLDFLVGRKILSYFGHTGHGTEAGFITQATTGRDYISANFHDLFLPALLGSALFMVMAWPAVYMTSHKLIAMIERHHHLERQARKP